MRDHTPYSYWLTIHQDPAYYARRLRLFGLNTEDLGGIWVCDYGCGPWRGVAGIAELATRRYAIDRAAEQYQVWPGAPDIQILPDASTVPTASCDLTICWDVLDHTHQRHGLLHELTRLTRPEGICAIYFHVNSMWEEHRHHKHCTPDRLWWVIGSKKHTVSSLAGYWTVLHHTIDTDPDWRSQRFIAKLQRTNKEYPWSTTGFPTAPPSPR